MQSNRSKRKTAAPIDKRNTEASVEAQAGNFPYETISGWSIATALLGAAWLIDPFAEGGFDAPKRLVALSAAVLAGVTLAWQVQWPDWRRWSRPALWILVLLALGCISLIVSTFISPRQQQAWPGLRTLMLFGIFLPLGAAAFLGGPWGQRLLRIAILATAVNSVLSLAQAVGVKLPIGIAKLGGRLPTGALLGNEGYVALACALMAAACLAVSLDTANSRQRLFALGCGALGLIAIAVNQQLTSAIAFSAAAITVAAVRWRVRWVVGLGTGIVLLAVVTAIVPPLRVFSWGALPVSSVEDYQRLTTYRLGPWVAAVEMAATRPFTGYGPGTFAAEVQTQRFAAEINLRTRLVPPVNANAYIFAHQDYLQLSAEAGIPTLIAFLAALGLLIAGLLKLTHGHRAQEPLILLAVLIAGAVAALAWFPMQIPFTAIVLLLACGRAWRLIAEHDWRAA
ncbi:MAG: O-antigen ligase family protein [Pseudomonadota bacterium]